MRVRIYQDGWEDFGAVRYKVEWETVKPEADSKNFNYDEDLIVHSRYFPTTGYTLAKPFARHVLDHEQPFCGLVAITKQTVTWFDEPNKIAQWENTGDPEYVDSPTAQN